MGTGARGASRAPLPKHKDTAYFAAKSAQIVQFYIATGEILKSTLQINYHVEKDCSMYQVLVPFVFTILIYSSYLHVAGVSTGYYVHLPISYSYIVT